MPCSDSSSSIAICLDHEERFISFDFAKITCGRPIGSLRPKAPRGEEEIAAKTGYDTYCAGKTLREIVALPYEQVARELNSADEETRFILYLEWDALRSAIAQYLGLEDTEIDADRCRISGINYDEKGMEIAMVILPPKELPKILPCSLADKQSSVISLQSSERSED
ncbi:MAG: hypothetical protein HY210_07235 [Candidatus Omnitrophica bacterium]|nr:hypothetical protein [Candidatus Omnitrophota bacterium]